MNGQLPLAILSWEHNLLVLYNDLNSMGTTATGEVMPIQTLRALTQVECNNPVMKERMKAFDKFTWLNFGN